jgi:hypothetical protein
MALYSCCASRRLAYGDGRAEERQWRSEMIKVCALAGLVAMLSGCAVPAASWKGTVVWPETERDEQTVKPIVPLTEAGAALAAAAAIREMVRTNPHPRLFRGCSSPEQGLDVAVFTGPTPGLYYVVVDEHFDRCGGPRGRVLDWHYVYAVTPQGEVVAESPPPRGEPPVTSPPRPSSPSPEPTRPPAAPPPETGAGSHAPTPPPTSPPPPEPAAPPLAPPPPAPPPPASPAPGTPK